MDNDVAIADVVCPYGPLEGFDWETPSEVALERAIRVELTMALPALGGAFVSRNGEPMPEPHQAFGVAYMAADLAATILERFDVVLKPQDDAGDDRR